MEVKIISFVTAIFLVFAFALSMHFVNLEKNKDGSNSDNDKIKVAATIFPLYDIVEKIGGDKVEVELIIPSGASPHTFEATPKLIKDLQGSDVFFVIGYGVDNWISDISSSVSGSEVFTVDEGVSLMGFEEAEGNDNSLNPHYWLDTNNAIIMAENVASKLIEIDPENKQYYESNVSDFSAELNSRENIWKDCIESMENTKIVVFHDAWGYFAKEFDLDIVASFEPYPGKTPSPQYLANLENKIKESGVKVLYVEPQFSEESVETLAKDLGIEIRVLDPLGGVGGRDTYIELIDFNVNQICS